jgi:uncharacterized protein (DUF433 family)
MYTFSEAGHLAHVSASTVRNWLFGYTSRYGGEVAPLFRSPGESGATVSFLQLIEIVLAGNFRKSERVSFQTVRHAYENARTQWNIEYPFAHLRLEALGGHIVQRLRSERPGRSLQALDEPQQWTLPGLVLATISQLDYELDLAARWYPVGKTLPIVVDPRVSAGIPTVIGRGVTIGVIHKRFKAGQRLDFIAQDFELETATVEEAVRYAEQVAA